MQTGPISEHTIRSTSKPSSEELDRLILNLCNTGSIDDVSRIHTLWLQLSEWRILDLPVELLQRVLEFLPGSRTNAKVVSKLFSELIVPKPLDILEVDNVGEICNIRERILNESFDYNVGYKVLYLYEYPNIYYLEKLLRTTQAKTIVLDCRFAKRAIPIIQRYRHKFEKFILFDAPYNRYPKVPETLIRQWNVRLPFDDCAYIFQIVILRRKMFTRLFS